MIPKNYWHNEREYLAVETHPGIFVSAHGDMITFRRGGPFPRGGIMHREPRVMRGGPDKDGYLYISQPKRFVHEVVIATWQCPRPAPKLEVRHIDGNKLNNANSNLVWGTSKENGKDKAAHGSCKGHKNAAAKMSESFVIELRQQGQHMPLTALLKLHPQYSKFAIWAALTGYTWAHLPNAKKTNRKCSKEGWKSGVRLRK